MEVHGSLWQVLIAIDLAGQASYIPRDVTKCDFTRNSPKRGFTCRLILR